MVEVVSVDGLLGGLMLVESGRLSVPTQGRPSAGVLVASVISADPADLGALAGFLGSLPRSTTRKRGYHGIYYQISPKHLARYVTEFAGRHNHCSLDTEKQMEAIAPGFEESRLRYVDPVD